jgi:hypothetical protein
MLDRSDTPNLFAQDTPTEPLAPPPAQPVTETRQPRQARRERPTRASLVRPRISGLRTAARVRLGQLRTYRRYAPVLVLLLLLLTHPAGCGRSGSPTAVTSGPSVTPAGSAAPVAQKVTVNAPVPRKRAPAKRARSHPGQRPPVHISARASSPSARPVPAPAGPSAAPSLSYQPAATSSPAPPGGGGGHQEFGFER